MNKIQELREKRAKAWDTAKAFLDTKRGTDGLLAAEDVAVYDKMEADVVNLGKEIDRLERQSALDAELAKITSSPLTEKPGIKSSNIRTGIASDEYREAFWHHMRNRAGYNVYNALQIGTDSEGGYLVPDEFENNLVQGLEKENIMRGLCHVIRTSSGDRKIPIAASKGTATWIEEEGPSAESDDSFNQITLSAHKVSSLLKISEELLNDAAFDLASYIAYEFGRRVGAAEEAAFITGDGNHKPLGVLNDTYGADVGVTSASSTAITADELIDLIYSLKSGYRRRAVFIMNDATVKMVRKLKSGEGQYLWAPGLLTGQPDTILNQRLLSSSNMPLAAAGNKVVFYGDLSYYWIADRQGRNLQRLNELYSVNGQIGFRITQRVDGRFILPEAGKVLKTKV
jgi:HK97 family phage major capsid protein